MKIKKYISSNLSEGKRNILRELGEDAVILSSREFTVPESGERKVEIVAAVDNQLPAVSKKFLKEKSTKSALIDKNEQQNSGSDEILAALEIINKKIDGIEDDVKYKFASSLSDTHAKMYKLLINAGLTEKYSLELLAKVSEIGFIGNARDMFFKARQLLTENILISEPLQSGNKRRVFLFIGPSGSGKTSALVKLAAVCNLVLKSNVLMVTSDNIKVGGADQLRTYASILGIPFKSVSNSADLANLIESESLRDIIFIDTAGKNPFNSDNIQELKFLAQSVKDIHTFLILNANMDIRTLDELFNIYKEVDPKDLILTKVDETKALGSVLSIVHKHKVPLAYCTNGQNVPEDIEPAEREILGKFVLPDEKLKEL